MSQLKKGVFLSYTQIILTNVIGIVLTPFIIRSLGNSEYGLYTLIGAFVGYLSIMDLGLNGTIVRYIAKYRAEKDEKGESIFLSTTMMVYILISICILLIGIVLYLNIELIFSASLTAEELSKAKTMTLILLFNLTITLPGSAFEAICNGYEHFVYPRSMSIMRYLMRSVLVVLILTLGFKSIALVVLDTLMNISVILSNGWYVYKKLNIKINIGFKFFKVDLLKDIMSYSVWIFVMAIVTQFQWKSGQIILGITKDTATVAIYAVGVVLGGYYGAFASAINSVFLPKAMKMVVNNETSQVLTNEMIKIGRIVLIVLLLILGGFIVLGKEFVYLWVGEEYKDSWAIALLIMIVSTNILTQSFADSILRAKKLFKFKGLTYIISILLGVLLGYFLIDSYGSLGMIIGISTSWFISQMIMNIYFSKKLGLEISRFYFELTNRLLLIFLIITPLGIYFNKNFIDYSWISFIIKALVFVFIYSIPIYFLGMNKYEKNLLSTINKR